MKQLYLDSNILFKGTEEEFIAIKEFKWKQWFKDGHLHREDGPAVIYSDGSQEWFQNGKLHREDGPAAIYSEGEKRWCQHGLLHREDGPAIICSDGTELWYQNGLHHRINGPAVIYADGEKQWCQYGRLHREDGPAIVYNNGRKAYFLNGDEIPEDKYYTSKSKELKTGVWIPASEAPDNLNEDTKKHVILFVHSDKFYNEKYEQYRAYRVNKIWWIFLGGTYFRLDENRKKPIKFFIVPEPESPASVDLKIQNIIKILDSD